MTDIADIKVITKRNVQGFVDGSGVFHPIRASEDYDPGRVGEGGGNVLTRSTHRVGRAARKRLAAGLPIQPRLFNPHNGRKWVRVSDFGMRFWKYQSETKVLAVIEPTSDRRYLLLLPKRRRHLFRSLAEAKRFAESAVSPAKNNPDPVTTFAALAGGIASTLAISDRVGRKTARRNPRRSRGDETGNKGVLYMLTISRGDDIETVFLHDGKGDGFSKKFRSLAGAKRWATRNKRTVISNPANIDIVKKRNVQGFVDGSGVFHPIRASEDYDPGRAGEGSTAKAKTTAKARTRAKARTTAKARTRAKAKTTAKVKTTAKAGTTAKARTRAKASAVPPDPFVVSEAELAELKQISKILASRPKARRKPNPVGWFKDCTTSDEVKRLYKTLARKWHPDRPGGDLRTMQEINADYDKAMRVVIDNEGNAARASAEYEAAGPLREAIEFAVTLPDDINVTVRGLWLWLEGNTYYVKDRIKAFRASDGNHFKFASKKKAWFFAAIPSRNRRGELTFDQIDRLHGRDLITERKRRLSLNPLQVPRRRTYEMFQGREATTARALPVTRFAPARLDQLGDLVEMKLTDGRLFKFNGKSAKLCAARGKLWIAGKRFARPNPAAGVREINPIGEIDHVVYGTYKPHHGDHNYTHYIHRLGEETGHRPTLCVDRDGFPVIRGGRYKIEARGIVN